MLFRKECGFKSRLRHNKENGPLLGSVFRLLASLMTHKTFKNGPLLGSVFRLLSLRFLGYRGAKLVNSKGIGRPRHTRWGAGNYNDFLANLALAGSKN